MIHADSGGCDYYLYNEVKDLKVILQKMKVFCVFLIILTGLVYSGCSNNVAAFNVLIEWGDYEKALEMATKIAEKKPRDTEALNMKALTLIYLNREQEAIPILEEILTIDPEYDDALNNMSWAYHNLGQYDQALSFIEKSLNVLPNSEIEYVNHGNALIGLDQYYAAIGAYQMALELSPNEPNALYGLGISYYWTEEYEQAISQFDAYLKFDPDDFDSLIFLGYSYFYSEQPEKALEQADNLLKLGERKGDDDIRFNALKLRAECENYLGQYEKALQTLKEAEKLQIDEDLYSLFGEVNYSLGNYSESARMYHAYADLAPEQAYPHIQNVYTYLALEDVQNAFAEANKAISLEPENEEAINALGNVYGWETEYRRAFEYFQRAVRLNPDYVTGHVNSMWALYNSGLYRKCVQYGESIIDRFPTEPDIYAYLGDSWSKLHEIEKAVDNYYKAYEYEPDSAYYFFLAALQYYSDQQYDKAKGAIEKALALEPKNETCLSLKKEIECTEEPLATRIADFVEQNYLYWNKALDSQLKQFRESDGSTSQIEKFIENIRLEDDIFTFCFTGEDYDVYWDLKEGDTVSYSQILKDTGKTVHYFDIDYFGFNTANQFIEIAEELPDKENSILVIDLRDNGGGLMESCAELLDYLLDSCVVGNLIYRDGTMSSWYSDEDAVTFNEIFVLINRYTASSSEMLALGLKKYLPRVTIVGESSFGKGVGQTVFDSKKDKVAILLVNFYWNVREENLLKSGIKPDIKASGDLDQYLKKVRATISK